MNKEGSAILLVISVISILIIICAACLRSTLYMTNLVSERATYQQHAYAHKALLMYVTQYVQEHFQELTGTTHYSIQNWPPTTKEYNAHVTVERVKNDTAMIFSELQQSNMTMHTLTCNVCRIVDGTTTQYSIQGWHHL